MDIQFSQQSATIQVVVQDKRTNKILSVGFADAATYAKMNETKQVYLDRPFVYMLIDTETNIPFFIGTLTDIERGTR